MQLEMMAQIVDRKRRSAREVAIFGIRAFRGGGHGYHRTRPLCQASSRSRRRNSSVMRPEHKKAMISSAAYIFAYAALATGEVLERRMECNLKPFEATQRVRHPPGRGAARQPEASLAWAAVTSLVKRRQRKLKPCVSLEIMYQLRPSAWVARGQYRHDRYRRGRVGSAGVLEQGKGLGWVAREPVRSRAPMCKWPERGNPADQRAQARMRSLPRRERRCEHE